MLHRSVFGILRNFLYITSLVALSVSAQSQPPKSPKKKPSAKKQRFVVPKFDPNTTQQDFPPPVMYEGEGTKAGIDEKPSSYIPWSGKDNLTGQEERRMQLAVQMLKNEPSKYVNPFIGTGGHGHTFPGAVVPFGMVQLSPDTRTDASWDGCGGYYYHDSFIYGFSHTHLSGTGVSDFGDVLFQPITHQMFSPAQYRTTFAHSKEEASPGYYKVALDKWKVNAEVTASEHTGMHRYTYLQKGDSMLVVIDLEHRDQLLSYGFTSVGGNRVEGYRQSKAWANNQWVFFCANFSRTILSYTYNPTKTKLIMYFGKSDDSTSKYDAASLIAAVGISFTDARGAANNLNTEVPIIRQESFALRFDEMRKMAKTAWDKQLNKIYIPEGSHTDLVKFYSALYHVCIHPSLASDVDLRYRGRDQQIHFAKHPIYSVLSLWDTYRALHPLLNLIEENRTAYFINSFLLQYEQGGRLPVWELGSCETDCMIGYHSVSVISDAILQGIPGIDLTLALKAMKHSSDLKESSYIYQNASIPQKHKIPQIKLGYIDAKNEAESVSKSLEYGYNDYCIAEVCKFKGDIEGYKTFYARSQRWINSVDPQTKFMRPRQNGEWLNPFDPREVNNHFTEANSYQYSFYVPQDIENFKRIHGGFEGFEKRLDRLFNETTQTTGREQSDISGLIGQYAHGNEPSHHMVYLYNYCRQPHKTQQLVQKIWKEFYTTQPDGLIGNEDCGQMSAWAVMSAMGIYAVSPISQEFDLSRPLFPEMLVNLGRFGLKLIDEIPYQFKPGEATNALVYLPVDQFGNGARSAFYLKIKKNDWLKKSSLSYSGFNSKGGDALIIESATLSDADELKLPLQEKERLAECMAAPIEKRTLIAVPTIVGNRMFDADNHNVDIVFNPMNQSHKYPLATKVFVKNLETDSVTGYVTFSDTFHLQISENTLIWAGTLELNSKMDTPIFYTAAYFVRKPNKYNVKSIVGTYNKQYTAGGDQGVVNGLMGSTEWRAGEWQGFQNQDIEYVIDLGKKSNLKGANARFLQDSRAWILFPTEVEFLVSKNGKDFTSVGLLKPTVPPDSLQNQIWEASMKFSANKVQFLKVKAKTFGPLPAWHQGAPFKGTAFIFIDEIIPDLTKK